MKVYLLLIFCFSSVWSAAQISGSSSVSAGTSKTYTYADDFVYPSYSWWVTNGSVTSSWRSGIYYKVTIYWSTPGDGLIEFAVDGTTLASKDVTIACQSTTVATPAVTFTVSSNACDVKAITYSGTLPSGVTWYWQTSDSGTSGINSTSTYNAHVSGYYYLRAYDGCGWSSGAATTPFVTVNPTPTVAATGNGQTFCSGSSTAISLSNPNNVSGTTYSWSVAQVNVSGGSSATNTSTTSINQALVNVSGTTAGTGTYIITSSANGCVSTPVNVLVNVNPLPVASASGQSIFVGSYTSLSINSTVAGTSYSYTPSANTNISNAVAGSVNPISQPLSLIDGTNAGSVTFNIVPSAAGCYGSSVPATVSVSPLPVIFVNGVNPQSPFTYYLYYGRGGLALTTRKPYFSYQWLKDGVAISGAIQSSFSPTTTGRYTVTVTGASGGPTSTSSQGIQVIKPNNQVDSVNTMSVTRFYSTGVTTSSSPYTMAAKTLSQSIGYQDGLGRTVQTIGVGASPLNTDIVVPTVAGKNGYADTTFLPYATSTAQGSFRKNAVRGTSSTSSYITSEQYLFYQSGGSTKLANDGNPYARALFRNTPDARIIEQGSAGTDWQPGTSHTVRNQIALAKSALYPVKLWKADGTTTGNYPDGTVVVTIVTDENNHLVRTYTDKRGLTVLKQVQESASNWLETYFIYDDYSRLIYQLPPKAVATLGAGPSLNANNATIVELIYKYTYDTKSRVVEKKVPGSVLQYIVYDKLDRVVLAQDGNMRAQNVWGFVKYDMKGRPVYSGTYASTSSRTTLQGQYNVIDYNTQPWFETEVNSPAYQGYSNTVFPTSGLTLLNASYYDNYDFDNNGSNDFTYDNVHLSGLPTLATTSTRGLPTGGTKLLLGSTTWLKSVVFYDQYDRPIQTQSFNHLNSTTPDKNSIVYADLVHVAKTRSTHNGLSSVSVTQTYTYDNQWRTTAIQHQINSNASQTLATYEYNELGRLVDKKLHVNGSNYLQSVDFRYNIRGWLASINNAQLLDPLASEPVMDYFGMEIYYNTGATPNIINNTRAYNGNISAIKWKGPGYDQTTNNQRSYKYEYDHSDRLKTATFAVGMINNTLTESNTLNETITYDANGNILTLARNQNQRGLSGITVTSTPQTIDNLGYTYATGNQLSKVEDVIAATIGKGDFKNGSTATTEYAYNTDGSLTSDLNKGISSIAYNILGKPSLITFSDGRTVSYAYDAAGTKLKMTTVVSGTTTTTDYVNAFVYENNLLKFFGSPEGRVVKNGNSYEYQYAIADHQGNTRVLFTSATPVVQTKTATFEALTNSDFQNYTRSNFDLFDHTDAGNVSTYSQRLTGASGSQVGVSKSYTVYAGDKVKIEAWAKYYNPQSTGANISGFAAALTGAFGVSSASTGEALKAYNALTNYGGLTASGTNGHTNNGYPKLFVNILLFDKNYNLVDATWQQIDGGEQPWGNATKLPHDYMSAELTAKETGFAYVYISHENATLVEGYFDDVAMSLTPSNILQYNEYYPFGLQTANSWTRENTTGNNFLANGGTELNTTSSLYDLDYRNYDPILGRMNGVDPMADKYASLTPYNYSFNDPITFNDPSGADPWDDRVRSPIIDPSSGGGSPYAGSGGGLTLINPGFSESIWSTLGSMAQSAWDAVPWQNGAGNFSYNNGSLTSFDAFGFDPKTGSGWVASSNVAMANADWRTVAGIVTSQVINTITASNGWAHTAFGSHDQQNIMSAFNALGIPLIGNAFLLQEVEVNGRRLDNNSPGFLTYLGLSFDASTTIVATEFAIQEILFGADMAKKVKLEKVLKKFAKVSGVFDMIQHGGSAIDAFRSDGINSMDGWINVGKFGIDAVMTLGKVNPYVTGAWALYNTWEDLQSFYKN